MKTDGTIVVNSDDIVTGTLHPKRVIVVGGGAVGCEFASYFRDLGAATTIVEMLPALVPLVGPILLGSLIDVLRREGALDYTAIVVAGASDPAPLQYIAPYAGTAMADTLAETAFTNASNAPTATAVSTSTGTPSSNCVFWRSFKYFSKSASRWADNWPRIL